jgi:hypothetical protein
MAVVFKTWMEFNIKMDLEGLEYQDTDRIDLMQYVFHLKAVVSKFRNEVHMEWRIL